MTATTANPARSTTLVTFTLDATPERVFPLLCPVREREWIPGWQATMVHSASGVAELGCVFVHQGATWITTRYEPPTRIDYTVFDPHQVVVRTLELVLTPTAAGTSVQVRLTATPTLPDAPADPLADERSRTLWALRREQLAHHLATGTMLTA